MQSGSSLLRLPNELLERIFEMSRPLVYTEAGYVMTQSFASSPLALIRLTCKRCHAVATRMLFAEVRVYVGKEARIGGSVDPRHIASNAATALFAQHLARVDLYQKEWTLNDAASTWLLSCARLEALHLSADGGLAAALVTARQIPRLGLLKLSGFRNDRYSSPVHGAFRQLLATSLHLKTLAVSMYFDGSATPSSADCSAIPTCSVVTVESVELNPGMMALHRLVCRSPRLTTFSLLYDPHAEVDLITALSTEFRNTLQHLNLTVANKLHSPGIRWVNACKALRTLSIECLEFNTDYDMGIALDAWDCTPFPVLEELAVNVEAEEVDVASEAANACIRALERVTFAPALRRFRFEGYCGNEWGGIKGAKSRLMNKFGRLRALCLDRSVVPAIAYYSREGVLEGDIQNVELTVCRRNSPRFDWTDLSSTSPRPSHSR